jgi:hypothetical protein
VEAYPEVAQDTDDVEFLGEALESWDLEAIKGAQIEGTAAEGARGKQHKDLEVEAGADLGSNIGESGAAAVAALRDEQTDREGNGFHPR